MSQNNGTHKSISGNSGNSGPQNGDFCVTTNASFFIPQSCDFTALADESLGSLSGSTCVD
jgi:hypothetical protein